MPAGLLALADLFVEVRPRDELFPVFVDLRVDAVLDVLLCLAELRDPVQPALSMCGEFAGIE